MHRLGISPELLTRTVNDPDLRLVSDGFDRVIVVRWIDSESAILVDGIVTKRTEDPELHCTRIREVVAQLAIRVSNMLPAGRFDRQTSLPELLLVVAASFGLKVSCHTSEDAAYLYEGPWDGSAPRLYGDTSGSAVYVGGSFSPDLKRCKLVWSLDLHRYVAWFNEHLARSVEATIPRVTPLDLVQAQKRLLEALFPPGWFSRETQRHSQHPAYVQWRLCVELLARKGRIRLPDDTEVVHTFLSTWLDNLILLQATHGTIDGLEFGDLANYGDEAVCRRFRAVIQEPDQFLDVLVEVSCAAWHVSRGHDVMATENAGMPDLTLEIPDWRLPIQADCKRVGKAATYSRFKKVIEKANTQIKRANQRCYGILYLDVSDRVAKRVSLGAPLPDEIARIQETIQRCLRQHYTSVGGVVLLWKDTLTVPMTDGSEGVLCVLRYRSHLIRHSEPKAPLPEDPEPIMLGYTGALTVLPNELRGAPESREV
jgi:hypothetical protein